MQLVVLGLNHKTAPVEIRECFSLSEDEVRHGLRRLAEYDEIFECVILSTCNRTEMYAVLDDGEDGEDAVPLLVEYLNSMAAGRFTVDDYLFYHKEDECIRHLMRVAASLDSLVVGEGQILSQVKKAYSIARDCGTTGTVLNTLFHRAIASGKKVRTKTRIAYNAVSVSYAAVELAKKILGDLAKSNILVLGAGEMSELTARHLVENGVRTVFVSNRNYQRAVDLAEKFHGVAVPFEDFMKCAVDADIIITSTGAPHYIIRAWDVAHLMPKRQGRPLMFIDIAVPRDVEPEVEAIAGVSLYNIDSLEAVVEANLKERDQEALAAESIIETEVTEIVDKFQYLAFRPTLASLKAKTEAIRQRVVKRALAKLDASPDERRVLENMSKMLVRKILRDPILNITEAAGTGRQHHYLEAVRTLFKLEEAGEEGQRDNKNCNRHPRQ
jgi:glutamyl-tRNA reductase